MPIDRSLNYGRHLIQHFAQEVAPFRVAVDLGAGYGGDLESVARACPTAELHGVELFPEYHDRLRGLGVTVHQVNLERDALPFDDESVDLLLANQVFEHLKDIFWALHEASRVLRVGGSFIIGVPNLASLHNRLSLLAGKQPSVIKNNSAHLRGYTRGDLIQLFNAGFPGGYVLRQFGGSNFYPFGPRLARPLARIVPTMAWGITLRFEKTQPYDGGFVRFPTEQNLETSFFVGPTT